MKEIVSFANGLKKDIEVVENAVASQLSNAFVEGNNSKVKTVKKAMYGRGGRLLFETEPMCDNAGTYLIYGQNPYNTWTGGRNGDHMEKIS